MNACNNKKREIRLTGLLCGLILLLPVAPVWAGTWVKRSSLTDITACPTGYIPVASYTLPDGVVAPGFCVMKYEAKKSTAVAGDRVIPGTANATTSNNAYPTSGDDGTPWVSLTWQDARSACAATGSQLISENQWLSLAHQVTAVGSNWSGGAVGSGFLYSGHNDNAPAAALAASADDSDGYNGTGNTTGSNQRRTLTLPNGQVIWDLAGNVWEWTDATIASASRYHGGTNQWMSYNAEDGVGKVASNIPLVKRPPSNYTANQGMGRYYDGFTSTGVYNSISEAPDSCTGYCAPTAAFVRGGSWNYGSYAGVFSLLLSNGRSNTSAGIGFRCTR